MKRAKKQGQRRMMYASLSGSEKYHDLPLTPPSAQLLYCLMYPHTDDFGNLRADPGNIKRVVVPGFEWTLDEIDDLLSQLWDVGLIEFYLAGDKKYLHIAGFEDTQTFNHERVALCPAPVDFLQRSESCKSDVLERKVKVSKVKVSEGKLNAEDSPSALLEIKEIIAINYPSKVKDYNAILDSAKHLVKIYHPEQQGSTEAMLFILNRWVLLFEKYPKLNLFQLVQAKIKAGYTAFAIAGMMNAIYKVNSPPGNWFAYCEKLAADEKVLTNTWETEIWPAVKTETITLPGSTNA